MSRDPSASLARAIARSAKEAGAAISLLSASASDWRSATFTGARHRLLFAAAPSARLDEWVALLPDVDLPMPGQLLAELSVRFSDRRIELDALTLQDIR